MLLHPYWIVHFLLWTLGFYLMWKIPSFVRCQEESRGALEKEPSEGSVIIPARNEAARIGPLLQSLNRQTRPPQEIIVVNDHSTDDTAAIARSLGATVIEGQAVPDGWTGKTWACWQGALEAQEDLLVFMDADVRLQARGLECIVVVQKNAGGLLTVQPYHETQKPYEELSAVFNIVLMAGMNAFTPQGGALRPSGGFGPCIVCRREEYLSTGGHQHESVRGYVLESIPLVQRFLDRGLPVRCYGGRGAVWFRMYPGGLRQVVEGWSKGFGSGALTTRLPFLVMIVAWISGYFGAFISLFDSLRLPLTVAILPQVVLYVLCALQMWWILRRIGSFRPWTALLFPIPLCFFALVMLRSLILIHVLGRVQWRGRTVATSRREPER